MLVNEEERLVPKGKEEIRTPKELLVVKEEGFSPLGLLS